MESHTQVNPVTGQVERGRRSLEKDEARRRWEERRERERDYQKRQRPPSPVEQAHTVLEDLKSAIAYARTYA